MKTTTTNLCLKALQLALIHSATALPLSTLSPRSVGKSLLLWDYSNTQAAATTKSALDVAAPVVAAASNWNTWRPEEAPAELAFYPTVRTMDQLSGSDWDMLITSIETEVAAGRTPIVQFLNEPEYLGVDAASAAAAWSASIWPLKAQYGAELVGVATSSSDAGIQYQSDFMAAIPADQQPDYIGLHYYTTDGKAVADEVAWGQSYLNDAYAKYGKKIFVNEIASTSRDAAQVKEFSDTFKAWMDEQPFIQQYAFFGATLAPANDWVSPEAQLMDTAGQWTDLGKDVLGLTV